MERRALVGDPGSPALAFAALAVFAGYLVFGIRGFGASPITIPLLVARLSTRAWAAPAGIAGGVIAALFGIGGPPYVIYAWAGNRVHVRVDRAAIVRIVAALLFFAGASLIVRTL